MSTMITALAKQRNAAVKRSVELLNKYAGNGDEMSKADRAEYDRLTHEIEELGDQITESREAEAAYAAAATKRGPDVSSGNAWVEATARKIEHAEKRAINSGSIDTISPLGRVVDLAKPNLKVRDLLASRPADEEANGTSYLRQTVRTNNADFVADGGSKPTSVYTLAEVSDRLRVLAHLSEAIPQRYIEDGDQIRRFLESEMLYGLLAKLDSDILNGDDAAASDEFDGLIKLAGAEVAFDTTIVETAANVLTAQMDLGEEPQAWVFNSADWQGLSLTREETSGQYLFGVPADGAGRRLHGLPVALSPSMPAGSALLGDYRQADLLDKDVQVVWNGSDMALFQANQVVVRVEMRVVLRVFRPASFKVFATSAV